MQSQKLIYCDFCPANTELYKKTKIYDRSLYYEYYKSKKIVSALAEGIDPTTGEVLPEEHVCNNVEVVRAFYALLQQENVVEKKKLYANSGKKWSEEDDILLKELFEQGTKESELQKQFMCSSGSINARLVKLGLKEERFSFWRR